MNLCRTFRRFSPLRVIVLTGLTGLFLVLSGTAGFLLLQKQTLEALEQKQECYFELVEFRSRVLSDARTGRTGAATADEEEVIAFMLKRIAGKMESACLRHMPVLPVPSLANPELLSLELDNVIAKVRDESSRAAERLVLVNHAFLFFIIAVLLTLSVAAGFLLHSSYRETVIPLAQLAERLKRINRNLPETLHDTAEEMKRELISSAHSTDIARITESITNFVDEIEVKNKMLDEINIRDEKTGLFNYRHFKEHLIVEVERAKRFNLPVSIAMIDIDHFKHYNDTHGHIAGDSVLGILAEIIASHCRATDIPSRFGGEEFAVLFPGTSCTKAFEIADRLRRTITDYPVPHEENQPGGQLTVSIGIASFPDDAPDWYTLINNADRALYKVKTAGRDAVACFASVTSDKGC